MRSQSLGEQLTNAGLLAVGLRANVDKLKRRGMDEDFISSHEDLYKNVSGINAEQEALKSRLKEKTVEFDDAFAALKVKTAEARKVIKLELQQVSWKEFGINDVR